MTSTKVGWGRHEEKLAFPSLPLPFWQAREMCVFVCLYHGLVIQRIPRKQNTWIQCCFCRTWFNPCSPYSVLTTKQRVHLKKGWASSVLLLKLCNGAGKKTQFLGAKSKWTKARGAGKHCVSHTARLFHGFDALSCSLLCLPKSHCSFCLSLPEESPFPEVFLRQYKKGWGRFDCNFPYPSTERGHVAGE